MDRLLGGADGEPFVDDPVEQLTASRIVGDGQQRPRVAGGDVAALHRRQDVVRQLQQAQGIGDGDAALADAPGNLLLRMAAELHEAAVAARLIDRIEVGALQVFHERQLQVLDPLGRAYDGRNGRQSGKASRAEAALAGDDAVAVAIGLYHQGLEHPVRGDRVGEFLKLVAVERAAWLVAVGGDLVD